MCFRYLSSGKVYTPCLCSACTADRLVATLPSLSSDEPPKKLIRLQDIGGVALTDEEVAPIFELAHKIAGSRGDVLEKAKGELRRQINRREALDKQAKIAVVKLATTLSESAKCDENIALLSAQIDSETIMNAS